jgi:hypothetical protein
VNEKLQVLVKTYKGKQTEAMEMFQADATTIASQGYYPTSQSWAEGSYGCGSFLLALLACLILIGIVIFIYMLLVKPSGTLTVTYERRAEASVPTVSSASEEKTCPKCAERVKRAATVCRFCGHNF